MAITVSATESNTASISTFTGTLNAGALAGLKVLGIALAGRSTESVGIQTNGFFGAITVNQDGSFAFALNNRDRDVDILADGETATERFVVTYQLDGSIATTDLHIAIAGRDDPGQKTRAATNSIELRDGESIAEDERMVFRVESGIGVLGVGHAEDAPAEIANAGSIAFNAIAPTFSYAVSTNGARFVNDGRVAIFDDGDFASATAIIDGANILGQAINNGVVSAVVSAPENTPSYIARAVGWEVGAVENNGLIEAISTHEAFGIWGDQITNNGMIYVEGGKTSDPLGVIGVRSGGATGLHFENTGAIRVVSTDADQASVGVRYFPNSSNPYQPMWIDNSGVIVADQAIVVAYGYNVSTHLSNTGHIEGDLILDSGVNLIANRESGFWAGDFLLSSGPDHLENAGTIEGSIVFEAGGDYYRAIGGGSVSGIVDGGAGADYLQGANGEDRLNGGDGRDWLIGGGGADRLSGGGGGDVFAYLAVSDSTASKRDRISDFTSGQDRIDLSALGAATVTLTKSGDDTLLTAVAAVGRLEILVAGPVALSDIVTTPPGPDSKGAAANDILVAQATDMSMQGLDGDDTLIGSSGADRLDGGAGADSLFGGDGDDVYIIDSDHDRTIETDDGGVDLALSHVGYSLQANVENLTLLGADHTLGTGNAGDNIIIGNSGDNELWGGFGNDVIAGGLGADRINIHGGAGVVVYNSVAESTAWAPDEIRGFEHGVDKIDLTTIDVKSFTFGGMIGDFVNEWTRVSIAGDDGELTFEIEGVASPDDFLWRGSDAGGLTVFGDGGDDRLTGGAHDDTIQGYGGDDLISGMAGDDLIDGGLGQDTAVFAGAFADSRIVFDGATCVVSNAIDGVDRLTNVEMLQFADRTVAVSSLVGAPFLQKITLLGTDGKIAFDASINNGGDRLRLPGDASDYTIVRSGSNAVLSDDAFSVTIPVGISETFLSFDDGMRILIYDVVNKQMEIGNQPFANTPVQIEAAEQTAEMWGEIDPAATARAFLDSGAQIIIAGNCSIIGDHGDEQVYYRSGNLTLDLSFNRGGDDLFVERDASAFTASVSGSTVVLDSTDGRIVVPIGRAGMTIHFGDDARSLRYDEASSSVLLGDQTITASNTLVIG